MIQVHIPSPRVEIDPFDNSQKKNPLIMLEKLPLLASVRHVFLSTNSWPGSWPGSYSERNSSYLSSISVNRSHWLELIKP